jgi:hypothetical protein
VAPFEHEVLTLEGLSSHVPPWRRDLWANVPSFIMFGHFVANVGKRAKQFANYA